MKFGSLAGDSVIKKWDDSLEMKFDAELSRSPNNSPIKSGPFTGAVTYIIEYY